MKLDKCIATVQVLTYATLSHFNSF